MRRAVLLIALGILTLMPAAAEDSTSTAVFAGGCFWCMEPPYDKTDGVIATVSGYSGGRTENPTYYEVSSGTTGHLEVLRVEYDPAKVSYEELLEIFWRNIDPLDPRGQFCDKGEQYMSAIFVRNDEERKAAEASKAAVEAKLGQASTTKILPAAKFYPAEDYHQDYYKKNPMRYKLYRWNCGRDSRLKQLWGE